MDIAGASRIVLRDWSTGNFPRYTTPQTTKSIPSLENIDKLYADDLNILAISPSRKEMWKSIGLVKLVPGELESRKVVLDEPWTRLDEEQDDEVGGSAEQDSVEICEDDSRNDPFGGVCDEEAAEAAEDEMPRKHLPNKVKRKREIEHAAPRPVKKVALASAFKGKSLKDFRTAELLDRKMPVVTPTKRVPDEAYDFSNFF